MDKEKHKAPKIGVVIPAYNDRENVLECLGSFSEVDYLNFDIYLVDDGSNDGTGDAVKKAFPDTIILKGNGNLWWSGATNLGAKAALEDGCSYIFTINNDVLVDRQIFNSLISAAKQEPRAIIGCKILYADDKSRVWYGGSYFDMQTHDIGMLSGRDNDFVGVSEAEVLTGMGMLIPAKVFSQVGFFDEVRMPQYLADSDLPLRAKQQGFKSIIDSGARVYSKVESSWVNKQMMNPTLGFIYKCYFAKRSPYNIKIRHTFYRRHWPAKYRRALLRFYTDFTHKFVINGIITPAIKGVAKSIIRTITRRGSK